MTKVPNFYAYGSTLKDVKILDSITSIGFYAFGYCIGLTSVTIGKGVTSIGRWAFSGCLGLTSVIIPSSVVSIGPEAFSNCRSLTAIDYAGNKEQWDLIEKRPSWKNNSLIQVIHCIDGDINL